jgi:outer membrane protein OmpA-like peptidoglycan-associated protein
MIRAFQNERSDFEFGPAMGEFGEAEFNPEFGEAEAEAEIVRDHRGRATSWPASRSVFPQRSYPPRYVSRPSTYRPQGQPRYWSRPYAGQRPFFGSTSRPQQWPWSSTFASRVFRPQQWSRPYYRYGQQQPSYSASTPRWGRWGRWPYGQRYYAYADPSYSGDSSDDSGAPSYMEPPPPPPVIIAAPPPPVAQPLVAEPPPAPMPPAADPTAAAAPTAQVQAAAPNQPASSGEFFIEPEMFEFTPEFGEYEGEWGEREGGFGEYEGEPAPTTGACPPYQRGEIEKSHSPQGHLSSDIIQHPRGLLIADFGVDWRTPNAALKNNPELRTWLNTMLQIAHGNPTTRIRISGYSDCVGNEKNNAFLRRGRAERVARLLQQMAGPYWKELQPRIAFIGAAPAGDYVADNSSVEGRAQNRGVLIEHTRTVDMGPTRITGRPTISPFAKVFEGPKSPLDALNKFFDGFTLVDMGLSIAGVAATEAFMLGAGIVITPLAPFVALGAPHEAALNELRKQQILEGLSLGIVLAADGRSNKWIIDHGYVKKWPVRNVVYPEYGKQLQGMYNTSLVAGIAHGRQFNTVAVKNLFEFLTSQMSAYAKSEYLGYPKTMTRDEWLAYSKTWSDRKWDGYYRLLAGIVSRQIKLN